MPISISHESFFNRPFSYGKVDQVFHPYILGNVVLPRLGKAISMEMSCLVQWRKVAVSGTICSFGKAFSVGAFSQTMLGSLFVCFVRAFLFMRLPLSSPETQ